MKTIPVSSVSPTPLLPVHGMVSDIGPEAEAPAASVVHGFAVAEKSSGPSCSPKTSGPARMGSRPDRRESKRRSGLTASVPFTDTTSSPSEQLVTCGVPPDAVTWLPGPAALSLAVPKSTVAAGGTPHTYRSAGSEQAEYLLVMPLRIASLIEAIHEPGADVRAQFAAHASAILP